MKWKRTAKSYVYSQPLIPNMTIFLVYFKITDAFRQSIPTRIPKPKPTSTTKLPVKIPTGHLSKPLHDSSSGKLHIVRTVSKTSLQSGGRR